MSVVPCAGAGLHTLTGFCGGCGDGVAAPVVSEGTSSGNMTARTSLGRFADRRLPVVVKRGDRRLCRDHFLAHGALAALCHATLLTGRRNSRDGHRRMRKLANRDIRCRKFLRSVAVVEQLAAVRTMIMLNITGRSARCWNGGDYLQIMAVRRHNGTGIAADVAGRIAVIIVTMRGQYIMRGAARRLARMRVTIRLLIAPNRGIIIMCTELAVSLTADCADCPHLTVRRAAGMRGLGSFDCITAFISLCVSGFCLDPLGFLTGMIGRILWKPQCRIIGDGINTISFCSKLRTAAAFIVRFRTGVDTGGCDF